MYYTKETMKRPVLIVAAHPDDEVLGCGGAIARFVQDGRAVHVLLLADGETSRATETFAIEPEVLRRRERAARQAASILGSTIEILAMPDNRMDGLELLEVVKPIESAIGRIRPSTVLTHHSGDVNIDHRIVHEAVLAACRPQPRHPVHELLFFEVPSSTEWRPPSSQSFQPNLFIDITSTLATKMKALEAYADELREFPHPRSIRAVEALANWRGATVGVEAAEAFIVGRQLIIGEF